jgi:hypothetical protein
VNALLEHPGWRAASRHDAAEEEAWDDAPDANVGNDGEDVGGGGGDDGGDDEGGGGGGEDDDVRWVTVATFWKPTDAQLARIKLESEGFDVVILDENLIATDWLMANAIGGIKLQVPEPAAAEARAVLGAVAGAALARPQSDEPVSDGQVLCPRCASPDIYPTNYSRRISFLALLVSMVLLPFAYGRRSRCADCGYEWR